MPISREQLAEWLQQQNVAALKERTGLSIKTIYRLRSGGKLPSFDTLQKLIKAGAMGEQKPARKRAKAAA